MESNETHKHFKDSN